MNSWTPLWSMVVESSLWKEPYHVRILFMTMLSLKDHDHVVRWDGYKLMNKAGITPEECVEALQILSSPDVKRMPFEVLEKQEFEGRRIEKVDDGWLVLNGAKYRDMMQKISRRVYKAEWQRDHRADAANLGAGQHPLPGEPRLGQDINGDPGAKAIEQHEERKALTAAKKNGRKPKTSLQPARESVSQ